MNLATLLTEARNPLTEHIDELPTLDMLRLINDEDAKSSRRRRRQPPRHSQSHRRHPQPLRRRRPPLLHRSRHQRPSRRPRRQRVPPTFSVPPTLVQGLIAGGDSALRKSSESSEDSPEQGAADLAAAGFTATGHSRRHRRQRPHPLRPRSPRPRQNPRRPHRRPHLRPQLRNGRPADIAITPVTGPEVLTGSTRLKAGTATKLVLNMLSTGVMIKTGAVYGNLMVNLQPTNAKLIDRAQRIIMAATGIDQPQQPQPSSKNPAASKPPSSCKNSPSTAPPPKPTQSKQRKSLRAPPSIPRLIATLFADRRWTGRLILWKNLCHFMVQEPASESGVNPGDGAFGFGFCNLVLDPFGQQRAYSYAS